VQSPGVKCRPQQQRECSPEQTAPKWNDPNHSTRRAIGGGWNGVPMSEHGILSGLSLM